ncbi:MAG: hypothetical protein Q7R47_04045 [Candidatus Diapherotrites archaeon]|nr:hypothetical protein [Candidatus Diapherotrites archaeon]
MTPSIRTKRRDPKSRTRLTDQLPPIKEWALKRDIAQTKKRLDEQLVDVKSAALRRLIARTLHSPQLSDTERNLRLYTLLAKAAYIKDPGGNAMPDKTQREQINRILEEIKRTARAGKNTYAHDPRLPRRKNP